jgi:hypothetical protein
LHSIDGETVRRARDRLEGEDELRTGYKVRPLTGEDVDRAAQTVAAIAAIPSLQGGFVGFGHGLEGGWWSDDYWDLDTPIRVPVPDTADRDASRQAIVDGLDAAREWVLRLLAEEPSAELELELRALELET